MTEVYLDSIKDGYIGNYIKFDYKGCIIYGKIVDIDLLGWSIQSYIVTDGVGLDCKQYENKTIFISLNAEFEFEFISLDSIIEVYSKELRKDIPNISEYSCSKKRDLLTGLIFDYEVKMGYRTSRIRLKSLINDNRLLNALGRRSIIFLEDVAELTEKEFKGIFGVGAGYVEQMRDLLSKNGLSFKNE